MRITATLGEGFNVFIEIEENDGDVSDIKVFSANTGEDVTDLISYSSTAWEHAWDMAERHMSLQTPTPRAARQARADLRSLTHDTPFQ